MQNASKTSKQPIGIYLVQANLISQEHLLQALEIQKTSRERIGDILVRQGHIKQPILDYFIETVIDPEQSQSFQPDLQFSQSQRKVSNTSSETLNRKHRTLNLPILQLSPNKVCRILLIVIFCLVVANFLVQFNASLIERSASVDYAARLFKLDEENNLPTLYSGLALGFCSVLLMIISQMKKKAKSIYTKHWGYLSWIFLYLAIDEVSSIHEILNGLRPIFNAQGLLYFAWVIPAMILIVIFLLFFWRFIQSLPRKTRNLFVLAGTIFVGGAIGVEMLGGYYAGIYGENSLMYSLISTTEEFLEMFGIVVFIYALMSYITNHMGVVNLQVCFNQDRNYKKSPKN